MLYKQLALSLFACNSLARMCGAVQAKHRRLNVTCVTYEYANGESETVPVGIKGVKNITPGGLVPSSTKPKQQAKPNPVPGKTPKGPGKQPRESGEVAKSERLEGQQQGVSPEEFRKMVQAKKNSGSSAPPMPQGPGAAEEFLKQELQADSEIQRLQALNRATQPGQRRSRAWSFNHGRAPPRSWVPPVRHRRKPLRQHQPLRDTGPLRALNPRKQRTSVPPSNEQWYSFPRQHRSRSVDYGDARKNKHARSSTKDRWWKRAGRSIRRGVVKAKRNVCRAAKSAKRKTGRAFNKARQVIGGWLRSLKRKKSTKK